MVGRLVEQQQVGLGEQHRRERDAHAPAARELAERRAPASPASKPSPARMRAGARRRRARADLVEPRLDLGDAHRRGAARRARASSAARSVSAASTVASGVAVAARRLLRQKADAAAARQDHVAALGQQRAADQVEQRRLAGAVAADEPDLGAERDLHGGIVEQRRAWRPPTR